VQHHKVFILYVSYLMEAISTKALLGEEIYIWQDTSCSFLTENDARKKHKFNFRHIWVTVKAGPNLWHDSQQQNVGFMKIDGQFAEEKTMWKINFSLIIV
jgi:hypothetical protein